MGSARFNSLRTVLILSDRKSSQGAEIKNDMFIDSFHQEIQGVILGSGIFGCAQMISLRMCLIFSINYHRHPLKLSSNSGKLYSQWSKNSSVFVLLS